MSELKDEARSAYYEDRVAHIKDNIDCSEILEHFGVDLLFDDAEVQYRCPLHGDGRDTKKSARYYPDSDDTYCWGCHEYRDHVGLVMEFEDMSFTEALSYLEQQWNIDDVPSIYDYLSEEDGGEGKDPSRFYQEDDEDEEALSERQLKILSSIERTIDRLVEDHRDHLDVETAARLYNAYDHLMYKHQHDHIEHTTVKRIARKLMNKTKELRIRVEKHKD
jgi:DNA primase